MRTFMDRALAGEIADLDTAMLDEIDRWHERPDDGTVGNAIHLWLGMTWQEFARWVEHPDQLAAILEERKPKLRLVPAPEKEPWEQGPDWIPAADRRRLKNVMTGADWPMRKGPK